MWLMAMTLAVELQPPKPTVLLVDNGSKRAASTLALRATATSLSTLLGQPVQPVSLRFSDSVPPEQLEGIPATTLRTALIELASGPTASAGVALVPLLLGPSAGLEECVQDAKSAVADAGLELRVGVAACLVSEDDPADPRVARAMAKLVMEVAEEHSLQAQLKVALVDHGTPSPKVHAVRQRLVATVGDVLAERAVVVGASMERREGAQYDFNEPLLENLVGVNPPFDEGDVIVSMAFLLPGRHAGPGGDVAQILARARAKRASLRTFVAPLLASQPLVLEVLRDRAIAAQDALSAVLVSSGRKGTDC